MANIGLYIELKNGAFKKSNRELLSLAARGGHNVHAVVFCADARPYLEELKGVQVIVQVQGADLAYQPDRYAATLATIIGEFKLENEQERLAEILRQIRLGTPDSDLLRDTRNQLQQQPIQR